MTGISLMDVATVPLAVVGLGILGIVAALFVWVFVHVIANSAR